MSLRALKGRSNPHGDVWINMMNQRQYKDFSSEIHAHAHEHDRVIKAQMEVTYRCNLHCRHCYTDPYNKPEYFSKELDFSEITRILDEMADYGILWLNFTGGEVFARKDFLDIYDYAYAKGFILTIYTNGTVFTEAILQRLQKNPPFYIDVSCHSVSEEAFDHFTQVRGSFQKFLQGMHRLKASGLPFRMKTKAMNWNEQEIPEIRKFTESFGLAFGFTTSLSPRLNGDISSLELRLSPEGIRQLEAAEAQEEDSESCIEKSEILSDNVPSKLYRCLCATNHVHISAWGELGTCVFQYEARESLKTHSLSEAIRKVFNRVRSLEYQTESSCRTCRIYSFCEKTPTQLRWETGDPEAPTPYHCNTAFDRARRFIGERVKHPLKQRAESSRQ